MGGVLLRWRVWTVGLIVLLLGLGSGCAVLDEQQRKWIFQPTDRTWWGGLAASEGLPDAWIDYRLPGREQTITLHGLWLQHESPGAPVVLHLHGARWDVRGSAHRMRRLHDLGFSVLSIDYRGFGKSGGGELPSEEAAAEDAAAAWRWLGERYPGVPRYVFGHSLGGAIAVRLAAGRDDVAGLIVEGSFPSIRDVARTMAWGWVPDWLWSPFITQRFEAGEQIRQVKAPVLVVHGAQDRLIQPDLGRALYEQAPAPKRFVLVDGGSHHSTMFTGLAQYREALGELFGIGTRAGRSAQTTAATAAPVGPSTPSAATPQEARAQVTGLAPSREVSSAGSMPTR